MPTVFLDANVFLYASGAAHPLQEPSRNVLRRVRDGDLLATTSTEVVQEILHVLIRRGLKDAALVLARNVLGLFPDLLPVTRFDVVAACHLLETHPQLKPRDALHAATMLNNGIRDIITADGHFEGVKGLQWLKLSSQ